VYKKGKLASIKLKRYWPFNVVLHYY